VKPELACELAFENTVQITQNALRAIDLNDELSREEEVTLTAVNHFESGASTRCLIRFVVCTSFSRNRFGTVFTICIVVDIAR